MKFLSVVVLLVLCCWGQAKLTDNIPVLTFQEILDTFQSSESNININVRCAEQFAYLVSHPDVAVTMGDAWSKIHSGIKVSTNADLGNWDECMTIEEYGDRGFRLLGKHCAPGLVLPISDTFQALSTCIPDACTDQDLNSIIGINITSTATCTTIETNSTFDTGAVIALCIFFTIGVIIVLSTLYDVNLYMSSAKPLHEGLIAFSLLTNGRKLIQVTKHPKQQVLCFHGIKLISMAWIVAGHGAVGMQALPKLNEQWSQDWLFNFYALYMNTAHLSVDSFFFISGFLLAYSYFKSEYRKPALVQIFSVPQMYLHRYLRLTPALLMLYLYVTFLGKYIADGPVFPSGNDALTEPCKKHWWSIFLYIQNYYNRKELCMTQLWYVSADMQLFVLAPLVVIPIALVYKLLPMAAFCVMGVLNLIFAVVPIFIRVFYKDYDPDVEEYDTHSRFIDYYIGFTFAMFVRTYREKFPKLPKMINLLCWIIVLGIMAGVLSGYQFAHNADYVGKAVGYQIAREVWCLCLCWLVYSCINGQGGIINWILSNSFMQVTGKVTYSMYLIHGSVLVPFLLTLRGPIFLSDYTAFYGFCGNFIVSLIVGTIWTLAFEFPMITVEKIIFARQPKPQVKKDPESHP